MFDLLRGRRALFEHRQGQHLITKREVVTPVRVPITLRDVRGRGGTKARTNQFTTPPGIGNADTTRDADVGCTI